MFEFSSLGVGRLLKQGRLTVPANQRPYAWEEQHVLALLQDVSDAMENDEQDYFLGTVVFVKTAVAPSIVDGQQRLATSSIILARIRDKLFAMDKHNAARAIDRDYLREHDLAADRDEPRLRLSTDDNDFFANHILRAPYDDGAAPKVMTSDLRASNQRLAQAAECIDQFLEDVGGEKDKANELIRWVKFLEDRARVVVVQVPDEIGAFRMFETLNDRGLKASQADILKNYFFSRAGGRLNEAQMRWSGISGAIATSSNEDENELLIDYIRHLWVTKNGPTKEKDLAQEIKAKVTTEAKTLAFLTEASNAVDTYLALSLKAQTSELTTAARKHLHTIAQHLKVDQIKPLLFAIARQFPPQEQDKAFRLCVSWSVRFLIVGGRGGMLDLQYSKRAEEVGSGKIKTTKQLRDAMKDYVPNDAAFEQAFANARVSRPYLARYYLRALDKTLKADPFPEYVANEDESEINLEHVMPQTPSAEWAIDEETGDTAQKYLGNMVLLRMPKNSALGNKGFDVKKVAYAQSTYAITNPVAKYSKWTLDEIRKRQSEMAKTAVKTWPIDG